VAKLKFLDSMAFLSSGLSKLIENVPDDTKLFLKAAIKERCGF
jgi:hypothetical protein